MCLVVPDQVPDGLVRHQQLANHHSTVTVNPRQEVLRDNGLKHEGKLGPDHLLLV